MATDIPEFVIEVLEYVRSGGETNMYARSTVIALALRAADEEDNNEWRDAGLWLHDNPDRYMEALEEMGAAR